MSAFGCIAVGLSTVSMDPKGFGRAHPAQADTPGHVAGTGRLGFGPVWRAALPSPRRPITVRAAAHTSLSVVPRLLVALGPVMQPPAAGAGCRNSSRAHCARCLSRALCAPQALDGGTLHSQSWAEAGPRLWGHDVQTVGVRC
jgi:hypothetical protein